jgi:hypothetical protein
VTRALETAAAADPKLEARATNAVERIGKLAESLGSAAPVVDLAADREFAEAVADMTLHTLRGESLNLRRPFTVAVVDDDGGGPYAVGPRDIFAKKVAGGKAAVQRAGSRILLVYSEPRSWKGHAMLSAKSVAAIRREILRASLVILFGHPRLVAQIPGEVPVLCAWHGQPLMQEAAAKWVTQRLR